MNAHDRLIEAGSDAIYEDQYEYCEKCNGVGQDENAHFWCSPCGGTGYVVEPDGSAAYRDDCESKVEATLAAFLDARMETTCPTCGGQKFKLAFDAVPVGCPTCSGRGTIPGELAIIALLRERGVLVQKWWWDEEEEWLHPVGVAPYIWKQYQMLPVYTVVDPAKESKSR